MTSPRITQRLMVERSMTALQTGMGRLGRAQEQLSTGRLINRPSDSPTGANAAMRLREELAAGNQYARNASDGLSWLGRADSTLTSMLDGVRRSRDLMLQGASTGSTGTDARRALAAEVTQIRESLLSLANTEHLGRPLFGGTTGGGAAYDVAGAFVGDTETVSRTVGAGVGVRVNISGPEAFGAGAHSQFAVLDEAVAALETNPGALGGVLDRLDAVSERMRTALADVGTRYGRVESALTTVDSTTIDTQAALSEVENVDIAKAIVDLQLQEVAYQAALGATARVIQPSLLDFLR